MGIMKDKIRDAVSYVEFPTYLSVFSVQAVAHLQKAMEQAGLHPVRGDLIDNPVNVSILAAGTGVSIANCFKDDHRVRHCIYHFVYASGIGMIAGMGTDHLAVSPYIAAFTAAASGFALRRNFALTEHLEDSRPGNDPKP